MFNFKIVPIDNNKTNHDKDYFIIVPKSSVVKPARARVAKDTFLPEDIASFPVKPDIYKYVLHCGLCDYGSRVRNNLVKHLKLHQRATAHSVPVLAPVNPPTVDDSESSALSRMTSLLPDDVDEELKRKPLTFEELSQLPQFVPENTRFACCGKDCQYITIDEGMLLYHIKTLHKDLRKYKCPHCTNTSVPFSDLGHHLKCHGELLFKCGHCLYYHWQKRTAEAHAAEEHATRKYFVKNVREDEEKRRQIGPEDETKKESTPAEEDSNKIIAIYQPYKCGLCEFSSETLAGVRSHCSEDHDQHHQYKCGLCSSTSDTRQSMEEHVTSHKRGGLVSMVRVYYIDPRTVVDAYPDEKRFPLWARDMEGLKHIRGILYDDLEDEAAVKHAARLEKAKLRKLEQQEQRKQQGASQIEEHHEEVQSTGKANDKSVKNKLDNYPMVCKECGFHKKTVTGMKMHIKLNHLQVGKFQCRHCVFTANLTNSIQGHYRNKHPEHVGRDDEGQEVFDYAEKVASAQNFGELFWKDNWDIPTLKERKLELNQEQKKKKRKLDDSTEESPPLKKKPGAKRGRKRKSDVQSRPSSSMNDDSESVKSTSTSAPELVAGAASQSPFESVKTFMCGYCPKRSQNLERIKRHLADAHGDKTLEWQELTRDQVVSIITSDQCAGSADNEYRCFYCQVSDHCHQNIILLYSVQEMGNINKLMEHSEQCHGDKFRVVKFQGKGVTGYLECQVKKIYDIIDDEDNDFVF